jgi:hypothetical protein
MYNNSFSSLQSIRLPRLLCLVWTVTLLNLVICARSYAGDNLASFPNEQIYAELLRKQTAALSGPASVLRSKKIRLSKTEVTAQVDSNRTIFDDSVDRPLSSSHKALRLFEEPSPSPSPAPNLTNASMQSLTNELVARTAAYTMRMKTLYGEDSRLDIYSAAAEVEKQKQLGILAPKYQEYLKSANSVAFITTVDYLQELPSGDYYVISEEYAKQFGLCSDAGERFLSEQCVKMIGTAFLLDPQLVCTASHCLPAEVPLSDLRILFGFALDSEQPVQSVIIKKEDVYSVQEIVAQQFTQNGPDWAILRLDRPCNRAALKLGSGKPAKGSTVYALGYPDGLPLKIAPAAKTISEIGPNGCFFAAIDTYKGNSGCPILDASTNEVQGILIDGGTDFRRIENGTCSVSVVVTDGTEGEQICSVSQIQAVGK